MLRRAVVSTPKLARAGSSHASHTPASSARLFGEPALAPGQKRTWQVWEPFHYALLAGTAALWWAAQYRPNTNPRDWARDEAEERMRRREAGLPVEFGVNYAGVRFMKEHGIVSAEDAERLEVGEVPQQYAPTLPGHH